MVLLKSGLNLEKNISGNEKLHGFNAKLSVRMNSFNNELNLFSPPYCQYCTVLNVYCLLIIIIIICKVTRNSFIFNYVSSQEEVHF